MYHYQRNSHSQVGFTLVELVVAIAVIAILVGMTMLGFGQWRLSAATAEVKSDLNGASAALQAHLNFNDSYPATMPATFKSSPAVTLNYVPSVDRLSYCVAAQSTVLPSVQYKLLSSNTSEPVSGVC